MADQVLIVIPARMGSSRFPGKPLANIAGTTMLERVWRLGSAVEGVDRVVVATDNEEIAAHAASFGAEALMTSEACATGTDRVAETAARLGEQYGIVFSLQGDAVLTPPWIIADVLREMREHPDVSIATPAVHLSGSTLEKFVSNKKGGSSTGTCVVFDHNLDALYFSKGLIPNPRDEKDGLPPVHLHIGLYGYRRATLERFATLAQTTLEKVEKLEQLRALEHGIGIRVVVVDTKGRTLHSVDSPEDVSQVESIIEREGEML